VIVEVAMEAKKYKSFRYTNSLTWEKARRGKSSAPRKPQMDIGSPPEFKGDPGVWCPEELLVAALNGCLMLTFISLAQSKGVQFVSYESAADGLLENVDGKFLITEVSVAPSVVLKSDSDLETARTIMGQVEEHCFISNSIKAKVKLTPHLRVGAASEA
jgi:organic hydroperoxide reductase OsmC/OhrA